MTAVVWPFKPRDKFTEVREWRTDVIRAKAEEQRIALRPSPRRSYEFDHVLDAQHYSSAQEIVRRYEDFLIPDWTQAQTVTVAAGSPRFIPLDSDCYDFYPYEQAILWTSPGTYAVIDLLYGSSDEDGLSANVGQSWTNATLLPIYPGHAADGLNTQRLTKTYASCSIRFDVTQDASEPYTDYPQYRGHDVMTDCPKIAGGLNEALNWPSSVLDNETGLFIPVRDRTMPDATFSMRWRLSGACPVQKLRRWLDSRLGRQKAFWVASRGRDFLPVGTIPAAATTITVLRLPGVTPLARDSFDLEIVTLAGVAYRRRVNSWVLGAGTIVLTLQNALGVTLLADEIDRISNLRCVRLNTDRIEFVHNAVAGAQVAVTVIEVNAP